MNRRTFLKAAAASTAAAGLSHSALAAAPASQPAAQAAGPAQIIAGPLLTNVGDSGATIIIGVDGLSAACVEYGPTSALGQTAQAAEAGLLSFSGDVHKVRLDNLSPGTEYCYRVRITQINFKNCYNVHRGDEVVTEIRKFRTLQPGQSTASFSVINDTHEVQNTMTTLAGRIKAEPADFSFWNGDVFNEVVRPQQMARQLIGFMGANDISAGQPMQLLRGNHDVRGIMARDIARYTDISGGRFYGSFRQGPVAFVTLDSGEDKPDGHPVYAGLNDFAEFRSQQRDWLAAELKKPHITSAAFRVVFVHIPLRWIRENEKGDWCSDGRAKWNDLLVKAGVDLVISGHTHEHAFLPADSTFPYAQLVGGGPKLAGATFIHAQADEKRLTVQMSQATGEAISEHVFNRKTV